MQRLPILLLILLVTGSYASGQLEPGSQSGAVHSLGTTFRPAVATSTGCPVGLSAERRSDITMLRAGDSRQKGHPHGLHITFNRRDQPPIESAEVTVYAVTSKLRVLPADASSSDEVSKTFQLQRTKESDGLEHASVWMHKVGALIRVEINSITYADGTTWKKSDSSQCRAVPSALMLISSK